MKLTYEFCPEDHSSHIVRFLLRAQESLEKSLGDKYFRTRPFFIFIISTKIFIGGRTMVKTNLREKLLSLSENVLADYVLKISTFVPTPPQRLRVVLSDKLTMVSYLEQNQNFFEVAGIDISSVDEITPLEVSTTTITTNDYEDDEKKEKQPPKKFGVKRESTGMFTKTELNTEHPTQIREKLMDDEFVITYYPLLKSTGNEENPEYMFSGMFVSEIEYNGKKVTLYDLQRKPYIYRVEKILSKFRQILESYDMKSIEIRSKFLFHGNGVFFVFITPDVTSEQIIPGFVVRNSYSSGSSSAVMLGVMNSESGVFLPIQNHIVKVDEATDEKFEQLVKGYLQLSRLVVTVDDTVTNQITIRTKHFVKDLTAYLKKAKDVEKIIYKK